MRDDHLLQRRLIHNTVDFHGAVTHGQHLRTFAHIVQQAVVDVEPAFGLVFKPSCPLKNGSAEIGHAGGNVDRSQFCTASERGALNDRQGVREHKTFQRGAALKRAAADRIQMCRKPDAFERGAHIENLTCQTGDRIGQLDMLQRMAA